MIKLIKEVPLWNSGYCQMWDFSEANASEENRIEAVTTVANVCRGDKGVKNPKELYQQLLTEHDGKPGSVFEFVPVYRETNCNDRKALPENMERFGYKYNVMSSHVVRTNFRSMLNDFGYYRLNHFNTKQEELNGFFVFKVKVPQMIVKHILRHRMLSFQEMSERTNKLREYFYCDELKELYERYCTSWGYKTWNEVCYNLGQAAFDKAQKEFKIRQELLNKGSHGLAYTTLWIAGWKADPLGWDNFFAVRNKKPAQREIIELATIIKAMME